MGSKSVNVKNAIKCNKWGERGGEGQVASMTSKVRPVSDRFH